MYTLIFITVAGWDWSRSSS